MSDIAQLIKLIDYITRYDWDTYRYPSQYIRIKRDNWNKLYQQWQEPLSEKEAEIALPTKKRSTFAKWKAKRSKNAELQVKTEKTVRELPETEQALKQHFLDGLLNFQFKWATSTVTDQSMVHHRYRDDPTLKFFLQRFPDTFLLMYYPVFSIKDAPIDAEIIFISPIGIEIICIVEASSPSVIMAGNERTWTIEANHQQTKILSPLIALKRTEQIVRSILASQKVNFSVKKTILSRTNPITYSKAPYNTEIIDKHAYENWFLEKRKLTSPLKSIQLKTAETLLQHCQTTSVKRTEWEEDRNSFKIVGEEP